MIDTPALERALREADVALAADQRGHLSRAHREAIWAALGGADAEGKHARTRLAIAATRHVLPIWERLVPSNRLPHHLLDLAEQVCHGELEGVTFTEYRGQIETELDNISWASPDKSAVMVGYAANRALGVAVRDEMFTPAQPNAAARDEDLEPDELDSAYIASLAASDGAPWRPGSSAAKRREYWHWWLREAVPSITKDE